MKRPFMKRMIWVAATIFLLGTGCEDTTRVWMTNKDYNLVLGSDCLRVTSGHSFKAPTSIEDAKTKLENNKEWAKDQKSRSFKIPAITALNTSAVDFINADSKIYSIYLKTPIDQWSSSEEIKNALKAREEQETWLRRDWLDACKKKEE
jgi:hypothetical protein